MNLTCLRFEQLVSAGARCARQVETRTLAVRILDQSLALWRGPALADIKEVEFASTEQARLEEERLGALESRIDALLACGRHHETIAELETLTTNHPLRERFWHQRLLALYRSGRQADALRAYRELRSTLIDQLGIEPGPELRELETRILRQDPTLDYRRVWPGRDSDATPQTHYVESGGVHIAYQVVGEGERDLLFVPGLMSHLELAWEDSGTVVVLSPARITGTADPVRQARHRPFGPCAAGLSARGAHARCAGRDERGLVRSSRRVRLFGGCADEHPVRRHIPREGELTDPGVGLRALVPGAGLPLRAWREGGVRGDARDRNRIAGARARPSTGFSQAARAPPERDKRSLGSSGWRSARAPSSGCSG